MSHGFLEFPDFDGAWRYSSTPSLRTAESKHITFAGTPTVVQIRAPVSQSLSLNVRQGSIASRRRRTQSDATPKTTSAALNVSPIESEATSGAERPISAILVNFTPIDWNASAVEPHPGFPADLPSNGQDNEAVSPKSKVPGALKSMGLRKRGMEMSVKVVDRKARVGTSMAALKSPYPKKEQPVKLWIRAVMDRLRG